MPDRLWRDRRTLAALLAVLLTTLVGAQALPDTPDASAAPPTGSPLNPVSGNQGFLVFAEGNAALDTNESAGPVALGGDLALSQTDLALGRTITASSSASDRPPSAADDGDVQTYWQSSSGAFPQTLTVDLGSNRTIDQITLRLPPAFSTRTETLSVLSSTNGTSFTTIVNSAARTFNPATGNSVTINFSSTNDRYIRLNITANTAVAAGQISEFEVRRTSSGGGNVYDVATQTAGTFTASGDAHPTGLLVGGRMDWSGSAGNGYLFVRSNGYVKVGDLTGTDISQGGGSSTHLVVAGGGYNSQPGMALDLAQPTGSVNQSALIDFAGAFSTFRTRSSDLAACTNNVVLRNSGGTPLPPTLPAGTNAFITLTPGTQNILNITAANLANISTLTFTNHPNASTPIVINVNTSGVSDDFSWRPPSPNGLNDADSAYILWNFPTGTRLTVTGANPVRGTLYTPRAGLFQYDASGVYGGVVAQSYAQGGPLGSPSGGTVRNFPFSTSVQTCGTALTLEKTADMTSTVPRGRVAYTVAATNSGGSALTGATFTDPLGGVLDDATYNNDAVATTGSVTVIGSTLSWTGDLAIGATATITYSVTVRSPDPGNHRLVNTLTSTTPNSNCATGSSDGRCTTDVPVADLVIDKSANVSTTSPGGSVVYTVTVTNAGQTAYTGISVVDDLTGALDDADVGTPSATSGTVTFTSPNLTWSGSLAVGADVTITFPMTVHDPDDGDRVLINVVSSTASGNNCPAASSDPRCRETVPVQVPGLTIDKSADATTAPQGGTVAYTVTITNTGQTPYTGLTVTDDLSDVIDDASFVSGTASVGTLTFSSPNLIWSGDIAVNANPVVIHYSVQVADDDTGDHALTNVVRSNVSGSNCPTGSADPRCTVTVDVADLDIEFTTVPAASTSPGAVVTFNTTISNDGQVPYHGITLSLPRAGISDDATANGDQTATSGTLTLTATDLEWTGDVPVGGNVFITGHVTVHDPDTGNKLIEGRITTTAEGSNCPPANTDPRCAIALPVLVPVLTVEKAANVTSTTQGSTVDYTVTISNDGNVPYTGATVTDDLSGVLDDADFDPGDVDVTGGGTATYTNPDLTWTGDLAIGASVTITYPVTVKNPDNGDKTMVDTVSSTDAGSTCPPARGGDCTVSIPVLVPGLTIAKTVDTTAATPGSTVGYTITATNTGNLTLTGAQITDNLTGVLDDANFTSASATTGSVTFSTPTLTWSGNLAVGAIVTITYSVTVKNPDTGNRVLTNSVTSTTGGTNCATGSTDPRCTTSVQVVSPATLTFTKTSNVTQAAHGQTITYTITVHNGGGLPYSAPTFSDDMNDALDDADYNNDATGPGTFVFTGGVLTWTGVTLAAGATATITYTMTVHPADTPGDDHLVSNSLSSVSPGSNCGAGSTDPRCELTIPVADLRIEFTTDPASSTTPGSVVTFNTTITNEGQAAYTGIVLSLPRAGISDDATANGDQTATSGTLTLTATDLVWTGDVPVGGSVFITGHVTVHNPDTGNKLIEGRITTTAVGSNCPPGNTDPLCAIALPVLVPELSITKDADVATTVQGGTVNYTVTIANTGNTAYSGATVADDLSGVLDDTNEFHVEDVTVSGGSVDYTEPTLTWTGNLAVGATVTVSYPVTVKNPDDGDHALVNSVSSTDDGSTCPPASGNSDCTAAVVVLIPGLTITKTATETSATPGATIHYTVTITNSGQLPYTGATVTDNLTGVVDDATVDTDSIDVSGGGTAAFTSPTLTWTGNLAVGATVTVTYAVTVHNPDTGDGRLSNTVTSTEAGNNCPTGSTDPRCTTTILVSILIIDYSADVTTTTPGGVIVHTTTITNTGQTPYVGASTQQTLADILDDATYNGDGSATSGTVEFDAATTSLVWTGDIPVGGVVTLTSSVTVNNPDTGDHDVTSVATSQAAGNNCPVGSTDPRCTTSVQVLIPELTITKSANAASTTPGATVRYTITVDNTGETAYSNAEVDDDLSEVLDDATYADNLTVTGGGTATFTNTTLAWAGSLAVGASVTISYDIAVDDPYLGDGSLINTVTSSAAGSTCSPDRPADACTVVLGVLTPGLRIVKAANATGVTAGTIVTYTITLTNTGETAYDDISADDDLSDVLDDATYGSAEATSGTVSLVGSTLQWTGDLATGASARITYTVTVRDPDPGDHAMSNTVVSNAPGSTCASGSTDPNCTSTVTVLTTVLDIDISADTASVVEGGTVDYTITLTNNGQAPYVDLTVTNSLSGVLDDATFDEADATATAGTLAFTSPDLTWSGNLDIGDSVTITYPVTVDVPSSGDRSLVNVVTSTAPGSSCPPPGSNTGCTATTTVVPQSITLSELTSSFALSGTPASTVSQNGAVTMRVTTNSLTGYQVTVQAAAAQLVASNPANSHTIPIGNLQVRETGTLSYEPLSAIASVLVHSQPTPSAPAGDVLSNDYQVAIPLTITTDSYTGTLTYVAMTL